MDTLLDLRPRTVPPLAAALKAPSRCEESLLTLLFPYTIGMIAVIVRERGMSCSLICVEKEKSKL